MRPYAIFALAVAGITGCMPGPDYVRPDVTTPAAWRIDYAKATEVANTKWWEQFGDPVLNELVDSALRENLDVRIAAARVDQFVGALTATRSQLWQRLSTGTPPPQAPRPARPTRRQRPSRRPPRPSAPTVSKPRPRRGSS